MPAAPRFTNGEVNRCGRHLAELLIEMRESPEAALRDLTRFNATVLPHAIDVIDWWRSEHAKPLTSVNANLRHYLHPHGPVAVTQRLKRFPTVVDKLIREPRMKLTQMADIGGCRALLPDQDAVSAVTRGLRKNWEVRRIRDYVEEPRSSGYRAVHLIIQRNGRLIELQLRTPLQDAWANQVEDDSRRVGIDFKSGAGQEEVHRYYVRVSRLLALRERGEEADEVLRQELFDAYAAARPYIRISSEGAP
jgi:putative GTP pyrophosphokinase